MFVKYFFDIYGHYSKIISNFKAIRQLVIVNVKIIFGQKY